MPLNVLLILVVVGIAMTGLLLHVLGKSRRLVLTTEDARSAWHRHFPEDEILTVTVTQDQHAARWFRLDRALACCGPLAQTQWRDICWIST